MSQTPQQRILKLLRSGEYSIKDLSQKLSINKRAVRNELRDLKLQHYAIQEEKRGRSKVYRLKTENDQQNEIFLSGQSSKLETVTYGLCSDLHFSSNMHINRGLREYLQRCEDEGITTIFVAGDVIDGNKVYRGHLNNLKCWKLKDQTDEAAETFNDFPDLEFLAISGNHDYSYTKASGIEPLAVISSKAPNFKYFGDFVADFILKGTKIRLVHGAGGRAYSHSYPAEVYLRNLIDGNEDLTKLPQILGIGHYHRKGNFQKAGVEVVYPGNFQGLNEYCARRGLGGPHGAYIIEMEVKKGKIQTFTPKWIQVEE